MDRIALPEVVGLNNADRIEYDRFPSNLTRALLRTGGCTRGYLDLGFALRTTHLEPKHYELVILRVAALSKSAYERMQHLPPAREAGWSDADIQAIEDGTGGGLDDTCRALLAFVGECVHDVRVSMGTFERSREYFSEGALADVALLTGYYMMTARFLETLDVALDDTPCAVLMTR
jgi:alkylhydroperoxidase family enzyme